MERKKFTPAEDAALLKEGQELQANGQCIMAAG